MATSVKEDSSSKIHRQRSRQAVSRNSTKLSLAVIDENELLSPEQRVTEDDLIKNTEKKAKGKAKNQATKKHGKTDGRDTKDDSPISTDIREYESRDPREILEEQRQEIIEKYYDEVRERARVFLKRRKLKKEQQLKDKQKAEEDDNGYEKTPVTGEPEIDQRVSLPTISEYTEEHPKNLIAQGSNSFQSTVEQDDHYTQNTNQNQNSYLDDNLDEYITTKSDEVFEMEKEAERGIFVESESEEEDEAEDFDENGQPIFSNELKQAMHEAIWEGETELLDDLLDLPGGGINTLWFGENLLMTAIRAGKDEIATYLIDNGIDVNYQVVRFEKRTDIQDELEIKIAAALEQEAEEQKKVKKKKKNSSKEKDKPTIEEIEKEIQEQVQNKSPELNPPTALTDMDCFYIDARVLAVEFEKEEISDLIDEQRGEQWPSKIKIREKIMRKELRTKMEAREDWVYTDEEDSADENAPPTPEPVKPTKNTRRNTSSVTQKKTNTKQNKTENRKPTKGDVNEKKKDTGKLTASKEKLADSFTVAGETEPPPTPLPSEVPLELIFQQTDPGPTKTAIPYRTTRSFLSRKGLNSQSSKFNHSDNGVNSKRYVQAWGSFMTESKHWDPTLKESDRGAKISSNNNKYVKNNAKQNDKRLNQSDDTLKYTQLRPSTTRQFTPWAEDDPLLLSNMFRRSKSFVTVHRETRFQPNRTQENTDKPKGYKSLRSQSNSNIYDKNTARNIDTHKFQKPRPKTQGHKPNSYSPILGFSLPQKARSGNNIGCNSLIIESGYTSPKKSHESSLAQSPIRNFNTVQLYHILQTPRAETKPKQKLQNRTVWAENCSPRNKPYSIKRYSPAGYLKGGHTKEDLEQLNLMSLIQQKDKTVNVM